MMDSVSVEALAREIKVIYRTGPVGSGALIEKYLDERLKGLSPAQRLVLLEELAHHFTGACPKISPESGLGREEFSRFFSLLLGKRISVADLSSTDVAEKLAQSLNTVFDTLNEIIGVMSVTLLGKKAELETIRQVIGSNLEGEGGANSLQIYLDQIQEAFLVAHQASKQAAHTKVREILFELDPDRIGTLLEGSLKFGPLRKAELFEIYREKFQTCKNWLESGHLTEEFVREFEKNCEKLFKTRREVAR